MILRRSFSDKAFNIINVILLTLLTLIMLYPMYFTVIASISEPKYVATGDVYLIPKGFTLDAYKSIISDDRIWSGYLNTIFYTVVGTLFNLALTLPAAYAWSKRELVGRNLLALYFIIPMYFSGGLIPYYLQVKSLGLLNSWWTIIILEGVSLFNVIVTRVFFQTAIPNELYESAHIDGASDFRMLMQIALPLAKPIIAIIALYYAVGHWNSYYTALIFLSKQKYMPLQIVLRSILLLNQHMSEAATMMGSSIDAVTMEAMVRQAYLAEAMKYALIFISSAPLLIAYPFVQKHFVKGVLIGALKG